MPTPVKRLQPRSYHAFRCIGAECEDTCCIGWIVNIDKLTFQAYQGCDDPELGSRLHELVTINADSTSDDSHARINLSGSGCPFLSEGLCGIQKKLGAEYLSIMCARYPRFANMVDDVLEQSLDLSCPEAARLVLLDPNPLEFDEEEGPMHDQRLGHPPVLRTLSKDCAIPYQYFREIRGYVIWLLQYRAYPLWKRLVILGSFCDELQERAAAGRYSEALEVVEAYRDAVHRGLFDEALNNHRARPAEQLEVVLELIVARISSDFTAPRFLACYQEFMQGIEWTAESSMDDIGRSYTTAFSEHYAPFMSRHGHMLEHDLVNYVYRTLFPLGPQESGQASVPHSAGSIRDQCLRMMVHYAIIQTVLIGLTGFHKANFVTGHVVKTIQSFTKAFEHSLTFPERALQILAEKDVATCAGFAILLRN